MKALTTDALKELLAEAKGPSLSFYLPTERAGRETLENPQRLRALIRDGSTRLSKAGLQTPEIQELLKPMEALLNDYGFWQHQDRALAVFLSKDLLRPVRIPYPVKPECVLGASFHVKPLLPLVTDDGEFFLLALSKNAVTFYRSNRFAIEPVSLDARPHSEADALRYENPEKSLQAHTGQPVGQGEHAAIIHGQGANKNGAKEQTLRFFRRVNEGLHPLLKNAHAPLVLATVEEHLPLYREANTYPHLSDVIIPGNPQEMSADALRVKAWKLLGPHFRISREKAAAAVEEALSKDRATNDVETGVAAACQGRADSTFVPLDEHCWGRWDEANGSVARIDQSNPNGTDLLDLAAVQTLFHGGEVYPVEQTRSVPGRGPMAVLFRY